MECHKEVRSPSIAIESGLGYQVKDSIREIRSDDRSTVEISDVVLLLHGAHAHARPMDASDPE